MSAITTHVLDTALGRPAAGVPVTLTRLDQAGAPAASFSGTTNNDGRATDLLGAEPLTPGSYRLTFDTAKYAAANGGEAFFPKVEIAFRVANADQHYHVPLLLSPFGYSTYRGS